jgi:hypothetical protein
MNALTTLAGRTSLNNFSINNLLYGVYQCRREGGEQIAGARRYGRGAMMHMSFIFLGSIIVYQLCMLTPFRPNPLTLQLRFSVPALV